MKKSYRRAIITFIYASLMCILLTGCSNQEDIVGTWVGKDSAEGVILTFTSKGSLKQQYGSNQRIITYELDEEIKILTIIDEYGDIEEKASYSIEGDILTIETSWDGIVQYVREE